MLLGTQAIVLHSIKYGDSSLIVKMFTRQKGIVSFMVKGVRGRKKGSRTALLEPLSLVCVEMQIKDTRDLQLAKEIRADYPYKTIYASTGKVAQVLFIAEVLVKTIKEEEQNDALFDFLSASLKFLDEAAFEIPDFHLKFLLEYALHLGVYPVGNYTPKTPWLRLSDGVFLDKPDTHCIDIPSSTAIAALMNTEFDDLGTLGFNRHQRQLLTDHLLTYFRWHFPSVKDLKTPAVLKELFE